MKSLTRFLAVMVAWPFLTVAEPIIQYINEGTTRWQCVEIVDGEDVVISNHTVKEKALGCAADNQLRNPDREYRAVSTERIRVVINREAAAQLIPGVQRDGSFPPETEAGSDWSTLAIGSGICEAFDDTAGQLTITAVGVDQSNACLVYQVISGSDIQITAEIVSATPEVTATNAGSVAPIVADSTDLVTQSTFCRLRWRLTNRNVGTYRAVTGGTDSGGIFGDDAFTLPVYNGTVYDKSAARCSFYETDAISPNPATDYIQVPQPPGSTFESDIGTNYVVGFLANSGDAVDNAVYVVDNITISNTITLVDNPPVAARNLRFEADFETGAVQDRDSAHDGFIVQTLPEPQSGSAYFASTTGCCDANSGLDVLVVQSATPPNTGDGSPTEGSVSPRNDSYYLSAVIDKTKIYSSIPGNPSDKPRANFYITGHFLEFDKESYLGFSIYLPTNLEAESPARRMSVYGVFSNTSSTLWDMALSPPEVGATKWGICVNTSDSKITETGEQCYDLGLISDDKGKWTDFIIRYRANPFESGQGYPCPVNPVTDLSISGAVNAAFNCDVGIFQLWKGTGTPDGNGNRTMTLMVNRTSEGVGLVPRVTPELRHTFKVYKGAWKASSTSMDGPIWMGFDDIRFGEVTAHGTGYTDVHPTQQACTDTCP